ncbi:hypothetical protein PUN28_015258 [Cardiocondyla obscurior]|uniref:Uncharacterized protein n=1 Tax=Cardiocondyla obscurior TaxID=286306 RepID=A0AAW2EZW2_9HYME
MDLFKSRHIDLKDCERTVKFCRRMKKFIHAMNCRTSISSLAPGNDSWKIISEFSLYLKEWGKMCEANGYHFISNSSFYGLKITIKSTLELCSFLVEKCNYKYIMTARLNQDSLEVISYEYLNIQGVLVDVKKFLVVGWASENK